MADVTNPCDTTLPNLAPNQEKAEGSRENVETGITHRPLEEEQAHQQRLPPRGHSKEEEDGHA